MENAEFLVKLLRFKEVAGVRTIFVWNEPENSFLVENDNVVNRL